jgi:Kdo2-lipid IVA lauroyltransferase/acyltransferase
MRERLEYAAAWLGLKALGILPRRVARGVGVAFVALSYWLRRRLRRAAIFNLKLAFPDWTDKQRKRAVHGMIRQIGWMAAEFSQFPKFTAANIGRVVMVDGFENFDGARRRGNGVIFLTGHMSAWELAPFAQALYGYPLYFLVRPITNAKVDSFINRYRCLSGNRPIEKNRAARTMLKVLTEGGTVGILADQNTGPEEGVFVDYFGIPACTTSGLARIAMRTDASVVPGFLHWDKARGKYVLSFGAAVELLRTGDEEADVRENTARFTRAIEEYVRKYPDQWLWVHKRWKNRPPGEKPIYDF